MINNGAGSSKNVSVMQTPSRAPVALRNRQDSLDQADTSELRFPGFHNSFAQSPPKRSPSKTAKNGTQSRAKGKEKATDPVTAVMFSPSKGRPHAFVFDDSGVDDSIQDYDAEMNVGDGSPRRRSARLEAPITRPDIPDTPSVNGIDFPSDFVEDPIIAEEPCRGVDWREEASRLVFYLKIVADRSFLSFIIFCFRMSVPDRRLSRYTSLSLRRRQMRTTSKLRLLYLKLLGRSIRFWTPMA